jgi:hypothetical protein
VRPRRCVWCKQEQDVCPEGKHADLGRRPWWLWRWRYGAVDWDKFFLRYGCFWQMIMDEGRRRDGRKSDHAT